MSKEQKRAPLFGRVEPPDYPVIREHKTEDGRIVYKMWPNRVETERFWDKAGPDDMTKFLKQNEELPKTKRKYETKEGKWVSYARARQLNLI